MRKLQQKIIILAITLSLTLFSLVGCQSAAKAATQTTTAAAITAVYSSAEAHIATAAEATSTITLKDGGATITGDGASLSGNVVTISQAGTYLITGTSKQGQIVIDADKEATVRLLLAGVNLTNAQGPAILALQSDKTIISVAASTKNTLTDGSAYQAAAVEAGYDAVIYSQDDLVLNGTGTLTVTGKYQHAINSKDDLTVTSGKYVINAVKDGLRGKDSIAIQNGNFTITAGSDALMASNAEDADKGWISIEGGTFTISAIKDALQATTTLQINGGTFNVTKCYEGLEGSKIIVNGGTLKINASDDALNAASDVQGSSNYIKINGGYLSLLSGGDGIDANGSVYINGGTVLVSGPTSNGESPLDYDNTCEVSGGTLAIAGSSGMAQSPGTTSKQVSLTVLFTQIQAANKLVSLQDASGKTIFAFAPSKAYQSIVISSPSLVKGATYTVTSGGTCTGKASDGYYQGGTVSGGTKLTSVTLSSLVTRINQDGTAAANQGGMPPQGNFTNTSGQAITPGQMPPDGQRPPGGRPPMEGATPPEPPK